MSDFRSHYHPQGEGTGGGRCVTEAHEVGTTKQKLEKLGEWLLLRSVLEVRGCAEVRARLSVLLAPAVAARRSPYQQGKML